MSRCRNVLLLEQTRSPKAVLENTYEIVKPHAPFQREYLKDNEPNITALHGEKYAWIFVLGHQLFSDLTFAVHLNEQKMFAIKYLCSNAAPHKGYCFSTIQTLQRDVGKHELLYTVHSTLVTYFPWDFRDSRSNCFVTASETCRECLNYRGGGSGGKRGHTMYPD